MKHTISDLYQMQSMSLDDKIKMTKRRISEWVDEFGVDGVYVSFSGGKDSTVLLTIARQMYGDELKGCFINTGLEYPEIVRFVKSFDNVDIIRPEMNFKKVIEKYGYPFISKEVSECVNGAKKYLIRVLEDVNALDRQTDRQDGMRTVTAEYQALANILNDRMVNKKGGNNQRLAIMLGMLTKDKDNPVKANIPEKDRSMFSQEKYRFLLDAPFEVSKQCCNIMKKRPAHKYEKDTGKKAITAQMASESRLRTQVWLRQGCNAFDQTHPKSNPMAFWTEQDVLLYIWQNKIPIASVYGDVVIDYAATGDIEGQMSFRDLGGEWELFDTDRPLLKTTGCKRTGCVFCGYGCHLEKPGEGRFERLKVTHPKLYNYVMKPVEAGGLGYKEVIDWINEHGGLNIKY